MKQPNWIIIWISFPKLGVSGIVSRSTISTPFSRNHFVYSLICRVRTFGCFLAKICDSWSDHVQYACKSGCCVRHSSFRDYRSSKKRKLEIATRRLARGWNQCPNFGGLFTSQVTWHYTRNLTLRRWITQYLVSLVWLSMLTWSFFSCTSGHVFCISSMPSQARSSTWETEIYSHFC